LSHEGNISVEMCRDEFFLKHALVSSDGIFEEIRVRWGGNLKEVPNYYYLWSMTKNSGFFRG